eukprot:COSAG01_NODE_10656_length_2111_cov_2.363817_1_plen_126_part_10
MLSKSDLLRYVSDFHSKGQSAFSLCDLIQPFSTQQLNDYLFDNVYFSLGLNRGKGKGVMYGLSHISLRQSFFNDLPLASRLALIDQKFSAFGLWDLLKPVFSLDTNQDMALIDVSDIGAGHSVYLL